MPTFHTILLATDFSPSAEKALRIAISLASEADSQIHVVHVFEAPSYAYSDGVSYVDAIAPFRRAAEDTLADTMERIRQQVPRALSHLVGGHAWDEVLKVAKECAADLIVVGTHGRRGVAHFFMGSVAERIVQRSPIPVLVAHGEPSSKAL